MRNVLLFCCFWMLFSGATVHSHRHNRLHFYENSGPDSLMEWLVGKWQGEGISYNHEIADELEWNWTLDKKFLSMSLKSTLGDSFKAEGYMYHYVPDNEIRFYEFSNMSGVRWFSGSFKDKVLLMNELPPDKNCELLFTFRDKDSFTIEESSFTKDDKKTMVSETFHRVGR